MTRREKKQFEEIAKRFDEILRSFPTDVEALYEMTVVQYSLGNFEHALSAARVLVGLLPDDHESLHALGQILIKLDRHQEALVHLLRAVQLFANSPDYYADLGDALIAMGQKNDARKAFEKGLDLALPNEEIVDHLLDSLDSIRDN